MKETTVMFLLNALSIICFTILAVLFHKWWIVLFSLLLSYRYTSTDDTEYDCEDKVEKDIKNYN